MRHAILLAELLALASASSSPHYFPKIAQRSPQYATPPPTYGKPLVSAEELEDLITSDALLKRSEKLFSFGVLSNTTEFAAPTRAIGSVGHTATIDYIKSEIASYDDYYTVTTQDFPASIGIVRSYNLTIGGVSPPSAQAMSLTPATPDTKPVTAALSRIANLGCDAADFASSVSGTIAFIKRGSCTFSQKSVNAGKAGALAAIVYNNEPGNISGTLGQPEAGQVATFGLSLEDGQPIAYQIGNGTAVSATAFADAVSFGVNTTNVIAQTKGGDQDNCVFLGAHTDSVPPGPGINDDGSGTIALLEVAKQLSKFSINNCVRFGFWAAEEEGLLGSDFYTSHLTDEENLKIRLYQNYDMIASPNYALQVYNGNNTGNPAGSLELKDFFIKWYVDHGYNYTFTAFDGRSDYGGFLTIGVPSGGVFTGAEGNKTDQEAAFFGGTAGKAYDECYHQLCDDVSNLNLEAFELNTKLIAAGVAEYALSFDDFPERVLPPKNSTAITKRALFGAAGDQKFHGGCHDHAKLEL